MASWIESIPYAKKVREDGEAKVGDMTVKYQADFTTEGKKTPWLILNQEGRQVQAHSQYFVAAQAAHRLQVEFDKNSKKVEPEPKKEEAEGAKPEAAQKKQKKAKKDKAAAGTDQAAA